MASEVVAPRRPSQPGAPARRAAARAAAGVRVASVNQDPGIDPGREKGAAVHLSALRDALRARGAEVVAIDEPDEEAAVSRLEEAWREEPFALIYERYAVGKSAAAARGAAPRRAVGARGQRAAGRGRSALAPARRGRGGAPPRRGAVRRGELRPRGVARRRRLRAPARRRRRRDSGGAERGGSVSSSSRARPATRCAAGWSPTTGSRSASTGGSAPGTASSCWPGRWRRSSSAARRCSSSSWAAATSTRCSRAWCRRSASPRSTGSPTTRWAGTSPPPTRLPLTYPPDLPCYFSPLKLREAMACAVVPVVPDLGDLPDLVRHGRDGLVYPAGSLDGLVAALESLIRDPEEKRRLGRGGAPGGRGDDLGRRRRPGAGAGAAPGGGRVMSRDPTRSSSSSAARARARRSCSACSTPIPSSRWPTTRISSRTPCRRWCRGGARSPRCWRRSWIAWWRGAAPIPASAGSACRATAVDRAAAGAADFPEFVSRLYDELARQTRRSRWPGTRLRATSGICHCCALSFRAPASFTWCATGATWRSPPSSGRRRPRARGGSPLWSEDPVAVCALWWRGRVESGRRDGRALGDGHYLEVRYEELVDDPARELGRVADFLGLPFAEEMLAFNRGKVRPRAAGARRRAPGWVRRRACATGGGRWTRRTSSFSRPWRATRWRRRAIRG